MADPQETVRNLRPVNQSLSWRLVSGERQLGHLPPGVFGAVAYRHAVRGLELQLRAHVLGTHLPEATISRRQDVEFWAGDHSTWQTFKLIHGRKWWLRWLVRRYPTRLRRCVQSVEFVAHWPQMVTYPWQTTYRHIIDPALGEPTLLVDSPFVTVTPLE